jgi:hypothetical protein
MLDDPTRTNQTFDADLNWNVHANGYHRPCIVKGIVLCLPGSAHLVVNPVLMLIPGS